MDIATLQRLCARTWPGLEQDRLGEWELRAAGGFTSRANSALPIGDPGLPLGDALTAVQGWYAARGLPPRLQVPSSLPTGPQQDAAAGVDELCDERGWAAEPWTAVMVRDTRSAPPVWPDPVVPAWTQAPGADWLGLYHHRGAALPEAARRVIEASPASYLSVRAGDELLGIGRAAVAGDVVVLTAIEVLPAHRRRGLGTLITGALALRGAEQGATMAALQVFAHNSAAVALYRRLGYRDHHRYRYRHLPQP